jgi:HSP20 family protein
VVRAELAGIDPAKDVEVTVGVGYLTIHAERHDRTQAKHRSELNFRVSRGIEFQGFPGATR